MKLLRKSASQDDKAQFLREAETMAELKCDNLVRRKAWEGGC